MMVVFVVVAAVVVVGFAAKTNEKITDDVANASMTWERTPSTRIKTNMHCLSSFFVG
jgi:hypothetical protein